MNQSYSNNMITIPLFKDSNSPDFEFSERTRKVPKDSLVKDLPRSRRTKIMSRDSEECKNFAFSNSSHSQQDMSEDEGFDSFEESNFPNGPSAGGKKQMAF